MSGYLLEDHDCRMEKTVSTIEVQYVGRLPTLTSWALTGLVATTLRVGVEEWKVRRCINVLENVFLNI
jgi:hypothetical protein